MGTLLFRPFPFCCRDIGMPDTDVPIADMLVVDIPVAHQ